MLAADDTGSDSPGGDRDRDDHATLRPHDDRRPGVDDWCTGGEPDATSLELAAPIARWREQRWSALEQRAGDRRVIRPTRDLPAAMV